MRAREVSTLAKVSKPMNIKMRIVNLYKALSLRVRHCAGQLTRIYSVHPYNSPVIIMRLKLREVK